MICLNVQIYYDTIILLFPDVELESSPNTDANNKSDKEVDSSQNSYENTGKALFIFGFIFLIFGLAVLVLLNRIY